MSTTLTLIMYAANVSAGGVAAALIACVFRRWQLAVVISRLAGIAALVTFVASLAMVGSSSSVVGSEVDPLQKARVLAEGISLLVNCVAQAALATMAAGAIFFAARRCLRKIQLIPAKPDV